MMYVGVMMYVWDRSKIIPHKETAFKCSLRVDVVCVELTTGTENVRMSK